MFVGNAVAGPSTEPRHVGDIALFRAFSRALTAVEAKALFASATLSDSTKPACMVEYRFDDGFGRTATDTSGADMHGSLMVRD